MIQFLSLLLAVLPPFAYLLYLMAADRREPEPLHMVLFALGLGILSTVPSFILESFFALIPWFHADSAAAAGPVLSPFTIAALAAFIQIAPVEEFFKLAAVLLFIWKNPNFNEENDGIVYVTLSAIGFALFENIFYVLQYGFGTGLVRSVTSIPLHTFCGVIMGYFVGRARFASERKESRRLIITGFALAWLIHGLYDTFALTRGGALFLLFIVAALFTAGSRVVHEGSRSSRARWDNPDRAAPMQLDTPSQEFERIMKKYGASLVDRDEEGRVFLKPEKQPWKAIAARSLLVLSILIAVAGYFASALPGAAENRASIFAFFAFVITVPALLGVMLEYSYRRRATERQYFP